MAARRKAPKKAENTRDWQGQAALFDAHRAGVARRAESPVVDADPGEVERVFGRGRPPGATNIATAKRLEMFARIGGDPLLASARILAMPTDELAGMLGCTRLEAEKFRQAERALAMPYVLSRRPQEVVVDQRTPPSLHLHFGGGGAGQGQVGGGAVALLQAHADQLRGAELVEILPDDENLDNPDG